MQAKQGEAKKRTRKYVTERQRRIAERFKKVRLGLLKGLTRLSMDSIMV
jgi:hypothetical protein